MKWLLERLAKQQSQAKLWDYYPHTLIRKFVNAFFEEFTQEVDPDVHVVMIWDQAGFHTSGQLKFSTNMTVVPLPPLQPGTESD